MRQIISDSVKFLHKGRFTKAFENGITKHANNVLKKRSKYIKNYNIEVLGELRAYVIDKMESNFIADDHIVDFNSQTCTCTVFQITKIPCIHGL